MVHIFASFAFGFLSAAAVVVYSLLPLVFVLTMPMTVLLILVFHRHTVKSGISSGHTKAKAWGIVVHDFEQCELDSGSSAADERAGDEVGHTADDTVVDESN